MAPHGDHDTPQHPDHYRRRHPAGLLLTLDEAARQLRCARRSVERHVADRRLRVIHLGRSVRVERWELVRFIAQMRDPDAGNLGPAGTDE